MLLDRACSQLLVIDVQERFMPAVHEADRMADRCAVLMQSAQRLGIPMTVFRAVQKGAWPHDRAT